MTKETEQCFCQSYYDENNELQDCTCGKCGNKDKQWEEKFDNKFPNQKSGYQDRSGKYVCLFNPAVDVDDLKYFIKSLLKEFKDDIVSDIDISIKIHKQLSKEIVGNNDYHIGAVDCLNKQKTEINTKSKEGWGI